MSDGNPIASQLAEFRTLGAVSLIWFLVLFVRQAFPPLFVTLQSEFQVSNTEVGFLFSLLMGTYALTQFPSGILSDRIGNLAVIAIGTGLLSLGTVGFSLAPTFTLLAVAASIIGLGSGMHKTVAIDLLSEEYSSRRGFALGVMDTIGQLGGVAAPLVVIALLASALSWNLLFIATAIVGIIFVVLISGGYVSRAESPRPPTAPVESDSESMSYRRLFNDMRLSSFVVVASLIAFAWNALSSFLPLYLVEAKGLSPEAAGLVYSIFFIASFTQIVTGRLSDSVAFVTLLVRLVVLILAGIGLLIVGTQVGVVAVAVGIIGIGFHGLRPVRDSYLTVLLPDVLGGGGLGIIRTVMTTVGSAAPAVFGLVSDRMGFRVTVLVIAIVVIGCLAILLYQQVRWGRISTTR